MQGLNNENELRGGSSANNKKIFIIICIYLFLTLTSKYSKNDTNSQLTLKSKLLAGTNELTLKDVTSVFNLEEVYQGRWSPLQLERNSFFTEQTGKFEMKLSHAGSFNGLPRYRLDVCIFNGEYVDGGTLNFYFYLDDGTFSSLRENDTLVYFLNSSQGVSTDYELQEVLVRVSGGETQLESAALRFSMSEGGALTSDLDLSLLKSNLSLAVEGKENNLAKIMVFAAVLFVVAFSAFSAIMTILKSVYELQDNPRRYSLVTICLTCMWDAALCIISFIYAFSDQESLMLFIMPAFLLCLLFTNLQPRLMILIYQQSTNSSIREIICKFNLFHYGTLFLIYPLLLATNLNFTLFLLMASIFFPQIYTNALTGTRPELSSPYYIRYLLVRMLIIVYLRAFPYNIFHLKPNYLLVAGCLLLIVLQFGLLYAQKLYGSKKVIPRFLLEPVFNYKLQEQTNVEEGEAHECSICLTSLASEPMHDANQLQFEPPFKLMRTPCKHNYHSRCLMLWMKVKMECPQCRYKLPPFE